MADAPRYRVTDKLDAGGMAEVYRGIAESSVGNVKRAVAIKKILPNLTKNKKFVQMFLDEARVSMTLQHANIVGVFDIGMADTAYMLVMEFVDGANLKTIIESLRRQGARMPVQQVVYVMMEVCKGLQYAHDAVDPETGNELGIVHRDISPPNILISKRGEVKLVDFGLAKATSQLETTDPGVVKGKFSYLSPEAASGKEVDRRADIFAVGILLYELLIGKRLFFGETDYQTVELVRQAKVPPMQAQNADVTPELEQIVRKALARDPDERYLQANDLQDALAQFLFSQRLKVTSRDVEQTVQACIREKQRSQPVMKRSQDSGLLIDTLINEEIVKFTSLDDFDPSGQSPSPAGDGGGAPLDPGLFVDTRGWADEGAGDRARRGGPRSDSTGQVEALEDLLEGDGSGIPNSSRVAQPIGNRSGGQPATGRTGSSPASTTGASPAWNDSSTAGREPEAGKKKVVLVAVIAVVLCIGAGAVFALRSSLFGNAPPQSQKR